MPDCFIQSQVIDIPVRNLNIRSKIRARYHNPSNQNSGKFSTIKPAITARKNLKNQTGHPSTFLNGEQRNDGELPYFNLKIIQEKLFQAHPELQWPKVIADL